MTTKTKSTIAAAAVGAAATVTYLVLPSPRTVTVDPPSPRMVTVESSRPCVIQSATNLLGQWQDETVNVFQADGPQRFFRLVVRSNTATFAWDSSPYAVRVHVGPSPRNYTESFDAGHTNQITIRHAAHSTNYCAATCYDAEGESDFSNEVSFQTQQPTLTIK